MACDRKIGPFDCCSVVQGDCLELMKQLPLVCECGADVSGEGGLYHAVAEHVNHYAVDAIIADPPYGIGIDTRYASNKRGGRDYPLIHGDDKPFDPSPFLTVPVVILWGANHYASKLPDSQSWLVWHKRLPNNSDRNDQSDCELAWSNIGGPLRHFQHTWNGFLRDSEVGIERQHPTQKPIAVMEWCIEEAGNPETILDPFCGSGTTLVAAKKLGRHFLGFEISPEYCEIARDRLARIDAQPTLFEPKPEQLSLGGAE